MNLDSNIGMSTVKCNSLEESVKPNLPWLCDGNSNKTGNNIIVNAKCCSAYKVHKTGPDPW